MSADADSESLTVLEFPEVESALGADILYLLRGTDVDRDRRITVDHLKTYVVTDVTAALSSEANTRSEADTTLSTAIGNVATSLSNEADARENADTALGQRIDNLPSGTVKTKSVSLGFNDTHVTIPANSTTVVLSMTLPAGSWMVDGIVNFQGGANIGSTMPACVVLRAWIGDSSASFNGDNMAIGSTPENTGLGFGSASVPRKAFVLSAETTLYLKAHCSDTPTNGTLSAFGRMVATSVPSFDTIS